ncbi:MAG: SH3 domain-containing protein [Clostridia bacterium]|nr:SH3 domain-containing protein [Clostridia bacterium]
MKRRWIRTAMAALTLTACLCTTGALGEYILSPNSAPVNVRASATKNSKVVDLAVTGTEVKVLGVEGEWTHVKVGDAEGYVKTSFITPTDPLKNPGSNTGSSKTQTTVYIVSPDNGSVNIRAGAGENNPVITRAASGTPATLITGGSNWSRIQTGDTVGYVRSEFLSQTVPGTTAAKAKAVTKYVQSVNSAPVNMRAEKSRSSRVVDELVTGTEVTVLSSDGNWSEISVAGKTGYIMNLYLTDYKAGTYLTEDSYIAYTTSPNGGKVRMRYGAGTGYHVVTALDFGTRVTVLTHVQGWARVRCGNYEGFINEKYLTTEKP